MKLKIVILVSLTVISSDNLAMLTPATLFLSSPDEQQERIQQEAGGVQLDMRFQEYRMLQVRKNILANVKLRFRPMK